MERRKRYTGDLAPSLVGQRRGRRPVRGHGNANRGTDARGLL